jgi:hypothetical protein
VQGIVPKCALSGEEMSSSLPHDRNLVKVAFQLFANILQRVIKTLTH